MGCLFGCFRVKDDERHPLPQTHHLISSNNRHDPYVSRNRLGSLLLQDNGGSPVKDTKVCILESPRKGAHDKELKDEAKFLKSCGTLLETPIEIRKASERMKDHHSGDAETSKFHSWLPSTSIKQLHWEEQLDQVAISPVKHCEDLQEDQKLTGKTSSSSPETSGVENSDTAKEVPSRTIENDAFSSIVSEPPPVTGHCKNKSVRFECESDTFLPPNGQGIKQSDSPGTHNGSNYSPYPTPLKLTDEMQTPGTVYPVNAENHANGKNARIRSQYVYHVLNPVQNFSQLMARKEEDYCAHKQLDQLRESLEQSEHASPDYTPTSHTSNLAMERKAIVGNVDASLSHWVKPSLSLKDNKIQNFGSVVSGVSPTKTPDTERPILGTVATYWNDDEPSRILPKWWDGNGIPNSTNKYKEDQKVSWHATPFEERLEKALSNETVVYQRRLSSGPVDFIDEESDTAVSRLQSSKHAESVVSF